MILLDERGGHKQTAKTFQIFSARQSEGDIQRNYYLAWEGKSYMCVLLLQNLISLVQSSW